MDPKGGVENGLTRSNKGLQTKSKLGTWQSNLIQYKDMRYIYSDQSIMQVSSQEILSLYLSMDNYVVGFLAYFEHFTFTMGKTKPLTIHVYVRLYSTFIMNYQSILGSEQTRYK